MDIEKFINENTMLNEVHTQLFSKSRLIQLLDKYTQALQLQQTGVIKSVCKHCNNQLCDSQTFNQQCFKCGKKPQ